MSNRGNAGNGGRGILAAETNLRIFVNALLGYLANGCRMMPLGLNPSRDVPIVAYFVWVLSGGVWSCA